MNGERGSADLPSLGRASLFCFHEQDLRFDGARQCQKAGIKIDHATVGKLMRCRHVVIVRSQADEVKAQRRKNEHEKERKGK